MKGLSIRASLTLWYGAVLAATLVGCGVAVYLVLGYVLMKGIDEALAGQYGEIRERLVKRDELEEIAEPEEDRERAYLVEVKDGEGRTVARSANLHGLSPPRPRDIAAAARPMYHTEWMAPIGVARFLSCQVRSGRDEWMVQVGLPLAEYHHELGQLRTVLLTILPLGLLAAVSGGYWLAGHALGPIQRITETARRITAKNLDERIAVPNPGDELGRLAETLNAMITRLEHAFDAMRQFTADASHELLTPLTAMRTETEIALRAERPADQYRRVLTSVLEEVERMTRLADDLLLLSREDARLEPAARGPVRLDKLVCGVAEHMEVVATEAGLKLKVGGLPPVSVLGDADGLRQVFFNLLDNAVKYTRPGGSVAVAGRQEGPSAIIEVSDTGIGIPPECLPRVFDRFFRVDKSRSRQMGGAGLGLSIAKALVERHGGRIEAESSTGKGSTFRVSLPIAAVGED